MRYVFSLITSCFILNSCYQVEQKCVDFKTGKFQMEQELDGVKEISVFSRDENMQVETFRNVTDSSKIRWINDCEMILEKINPKSRIEKKGVHIKILQTDAEGYQFEYGFVGDSQKAKGYAKKIK